MTVATSFNNVSLVMVVRIVGKRTTLSVFSILGRKLSLESQVYFVDLRGKTEQEAGL